MIYYILLIKYIIYNMEDAFKFTRLGYNRKLFILLTENPKLQKAIYKKNTLLITAVKYEQTKSFDILLQFPDVMSLVNYRDGLGLTALMYANDLQNAYMIEMLLKHRADKKMKYPNTKLTVFETALSRKNVAMAHSLNFKANVVRDRIKQSTKIKQSKFATNISIDYINNIVNLHNMFINGMGEALPLANIYVSHLIVNVIDNVDVYLDVGMSTEHLNDLKIFKNMDPKKIVNKYKPKLIKYTKKNYLNSFKKNIQWPHLPLIFADKNRGSCVDLMFFQLMLFEKQKTKYNFGIFPGSNTLMSHVEVFKKHNLNLNNKTIIFVLFSLYHIFRAIQVCRYALYDKQKETLILQSTFEIIKKLIPHKFIQSRIFKFLIMRSSAAYSSCIKLYKKKQITIPKGKVYERVPKNIKDKVIKILKNEFTNGIGMKENANVFEFIFNRKNIKNLIYFSDKGICVFRLINNIDNKRLVEKYNIEDTDGLYISFIVKVDKSIAGFAGHVFEEIFRKFRKNIYLEVKKANQKAIKVYELLGFKLIGISTNQLLYIHKGGVFS